MVLHKKNTLEQQNKILYCKNIQTKTKERYESHNTNYLHDGKITTTLLTHGLLSAYFDEVLIKHSKH